MGKSISVSIGDKFNRWEVLSEVFYKTFPSGTKAKFLDCRCECGNVTEVRFASLTSPTKPSISCGCLRYEAMEKTRKFPNVGEKFNLLTVVGDCYRENSRSIVPVRCDCGSDEFTVRLDQIKSGLCKSCGCYQRQAVAEASTTHGMYDTSAYGSWQAMKDRCTNPKNSRWDRYGGRGITCPDEWITFDGFWGDMSEGWFSGADIDRIDFDGNYCKENCRWVNRDVGNHNKSKSKGTSKYKGVYFKSDRNVWVARLNRNGVIHLQKTFNTEYEAALAYDNASEIVYGDRPNKTTKGDNP